MWKAPIVDNFPIFFFGGGGEHIFLKIPTNLDLRRFIPLKYTGFLTIFPENQCFSLSRKMITDKKRIA